MNTKIILVIALIIIQSNFIFGQRVELQYEIGVMDMNGTDGYYYFGYQVSHEISRNEAKVDLINKRIGEELNEVAEQFAIYELVEIIDSIGPIIEKNLNPEPEVKNIVLLKIGVIETLRDYAIKEGVNTRRVESIDNNDIKNKFSYFGMRSDEISKSKDLTINIKSKFGSEVTVEFIIYCSAKIDDCLTKDSLKMSTQEQIASSLAHFELYDMWVSERDSMEIVMKDIIKPDYPEVKRVAIFNVIIPEKAEEHFRDIEKKRHEIIESLFKNGDKLNLLEGKLESDKVLNKREIDEIEKEIERLKLEREAIREKGKTLKFEYKP